MFGRPASSPPSLPFHSSEATRRWIAAVLLFGVAAVVGCVSPERPFGPASTTGSGGGSPTGSGGNGGTGATGGGGTGATGGGGTRPNGDPCTDAGDCVSGACVDGVCCDTACNGVCFACTMDRTGQADGTCAQALAGTDPHDDCDDEGAASCGHTGACDGQGACALYPSMTECAPQTCVGTTKTLAKTCDGAGTCVDNGTASCAPFACVGDACAADCLDDASCAPGQYCDTMSGQCLQKKADGSACVPAKPNECASGHCADGICCASACNGVCEACSFALTGQPDGTCAPVPDGADPDGDCPDQGAASCGTDGACDGQGACRLYPANTVCAAGSCANGVQVNPDLCDGSGSCVDQGTKSCAPFACAGSVCAATCAVDAECGANQYCSSMTCVPQKATGASCGGNNQCTSGFCVDGVCCGTACGGPCQACSAAKKGSGSDGTCGAVANGTDPDSECADQGAASCGTDGFCNGAGACHIYVSGTQCVAPSCANGTQQNADTCNGSGTCVDGGTTSCAPYVCGATSCKTSCTVDADCTSTNYCSGSSCVAKKANGVACGGNNQCTSGFCVDGVCCATACGGLCQACSAAKKGSGSDGTCGNVANGSDPDNECAAQAASTCGTDGSCNGSGACRLYVSGTQCVAPSCANGTQQNADTCNGSGSCIDGGSVSCSPYICGATSCKTTCAVDSDCVGTHYCLNTSCVAKKANGVACGGANECSSGNCVDGVCCNTACNGLCQACSAAKKGSGSDGTCGSIAAGADPDNECATQSVSTCGTDGTCNGAGACRLYVSGTQCVAPSCAGGVQQNADTCNGSGTCVDGGSANCSPYVCGATACLTSCASNSDCVGTHYCNNGTCVLKLAQGTPCSAAGECGTGFCVDGVCCESACTGLCKSCSGQWNIQYTDGVCDVIEAGDPNNECASTSICCVGVCKSTNQCLL